MMGKPNPATKEALFVLGVLTVAFVVGISVLAVVAMIVGIFAAIIPARRAAKLNPLEALHYE